MKPNNPGNAAPVVKLALLCNEHCTYIFFTHFLTYD